MDQIYRQILMQLQHNAAQPVADVARKVGLSVTPCWRRIQRLEENGVIRKRVALLDPNAVGAGMSVFVAVRTDQHNADWLKNFALDSISLAKELESSVDNISPNDGYSWNLSLKYFIPEDKIGFLKLIAISKTPL